MTNTHREYIERRNREIFPQLEINVVLNRNEELRPIGEAFDTYRIGIKVAVSGAEYREIEPVIGHALLSYLLYLEQNESIEYAQFLLPPTIDPEKEHAFGSQKILIAEWEDAHILRNKEIVSELLAEINEGNSGLHILTGPMYAGKTDILLQLLEECNGHILFEVLIPSVMEEAYIHSRIGGEGRTHQVEVVRRIKADKYSYAGLMERLSTIELLVNEGKTVPRLIIIDEFSFFTEDEEEGERLLDKLGYLTTKGITVIVSGLHNNYRAETRPVIKVAERMEILVNRYTAFAAMAGGKNGIEVLPDAGETVRWDIRQGFLDLLLRVVIGRVHGNIVRYGVLPSKCHLFAILKQNDPQIFTALMKIGGREDIFNQYLEEEV